MKKTQRTETLATPHKYNHQNQDNKKYARNEKKWKGNSWCKKRLKVHIKYSSCVGLV